MVCCVLEKEVNSKRHTLTTGINGIIKPKELSNMESLTLTAIENYKDYLITEEKSKATIEKYIRDITAMQIWFSGRCVEKTAVIFLEL